MRNPRNARILLLALLLAALPILALAADSTEPVSRTLVIGDQLENITINTEGSELIITMTENGKEKVAMVDLDQVGNMVSDSLGDLAETLAGMQFQMRLGQDNNFNLAVDDQEWEIDLDAIMSEVGQALSGAFEDLDTSDWTSHHHVRLNDADEEELRAELRAMREELRSLEKELARMRDVEKKDAAR